MICFLDLIGSLPARFGKVRFMNVLKPSAICTNGANNTAFNFKHLDIASKHVHMSGMFSQRDRFICYLFSTSWNRFDFRELNISLMSA